MTFTATWTVNEYTITFDANGGAVEPETMTITYGETIGELPVPTLKNHDFLGWFDEDGNEYKAGDVYLVDGDLTLIAKWQEHPVIFRAVNTTLGSSIGLNFYVKLAPEIVNDPNTVMQFTVNGKVIEVPMSEAVVSVKNGETRYRFTCYVYTKQMADMVTAQIITSEGAVGDAKAMSVAAYCKALLAITNDEQMIQLVKAMLNYGAAAQVMFDYNVNNLANADLSEEDKVLADVDASAYAYSVAGSEEGIKLQSANLVLDSDVNLRVYFKLTGEKTIDAFTFYVDGQEVKPIQKGDRYYVQIRIDKASNMDQLHEIVVGDLSLSYGVLSYVDTVLNKSDDQNAINMVKALYAYTMAAKACFG